LLSDVSAKAGTGNPRAIVPTIMPRLPAFIRRCDLPVLQCTLQKTAQQRRCTRMQKMFAQMQKSQLT
jgi:hypothetical protein